MMDPDETCKPDYWRLRLNASIHVCNTGQPTVAPESGMA